MIVVNGFNTLIFDTLLLLYALHIYHKDRATTATVAMTSIERYYIHMQLLLFCVQKTATESNSVNNSNGNGYGNGSCSGINISINNSSGSGSSSTSVISRR